MRCLILDTDRVGLDMAYRAAEAGHDVKLWIKPTKGVQAMDGDGFPGVKKVTDWRKEMQWAKQGIVINMHNERQLTAELDKWKAMGWPVFGPTTKSAAIEIDRGLGMRIFKELGFDVPEYKTFKSLDEALAFAWKADQPYVMKPMGDEIRKDLTFCPSDPAELVSFMEGLKKQGVKLKGEIMLQEKVDLLMECGISGWMGKDGFLAPKCVNIEHKKLMNGDYGPSTGEQGTVLKYFTDTSESVLAEALDRFENILIGTGHIGDFDIGGAIDTKGRYIPFETTCRFGYPSSFIQTQCHKGDPIQWMKDSLSGIDSLEVDERTAIGLVMAKPPYPMETDDPNDGAGSVITGIEEVWERVSPAEMMIEEGPIMKDGKVSRGPVYKTSGPYVCCVTALGHDVHDAMAEAYAAAERIKFQDRILRTDIGKDLEKKLPRVRPLGYTELPDF